MTAIQISATTTEAIALEFMRQSEGSWKSQRRYYSLQQETEPQEVVSLIQIRYLAQGSKELIDLAHLHHLDDERALLGGTLVTWESQYIREKSKKPTTGSTIFGVLGNLLYRDRGFATDSPITAVYYFPNPLTMNLRTEYNGSVFEEELKLIGQQYRTRQTIISRAGEEIMIGQYLEKRM